MSTSGLKQRIKTLPFLGGLLYWLAGLVRMNAIRRQNTAEHAFFVERIQSLQDELHAQKLQHIELHNQLQQQVAADATTRAAFNAELQNLRDALDVQRQESRQLQSELRSWTEQAHRTLEQQLYAQADATKTHFEAVGQARLQDKQAVADLFAAVDEELNQAGAANDIVAERLAGLTQAFRKRAVAE